MPPKEVQNKTSFIKQEKNTKNKLYLTDEQNQLLFFAETLEISAFPSAKAA